LGFEKRKTVIMPGSWCPFGIWEKENGHHAGFMVPVWVFEKRKTVIMGGSWCPFGIREKENGHHKGFMVPVWDLGKGKWSP